MKHIIELDESDIRRLIAITFSVPKESVAINVSEEWVGCCTAEDKVTVVSCNVMMSEDGGET